MADKTEELYADVLKMMKDKDVKFVDLRFTDTKGKMQHVTRRRLDASTRTCSPTATRSTAPRSPAGRASRASDMTLMPDPATAHIDPFFAQTTMAIFCDVLEPPTGEMYERDPRTIAKKAEAYMKQTGVGDTVCFGPEAEFFIFDDVRFTIRSLQHRLQARQRPSCRPTPAPSTRWATSATVRAPRAATSRCRRSTAPRTSAPRCSR